MSIRLRSLSPNHRYPAAIVALLVLIAAPAPSSPQSPFTDTPERVLTEPSPLVENTFSFALAADGGDLLVSAIGDFSAIHGVAYLFDGDSAALKQTFLNQGSVDNFFGGDIAFVGGNILVAASEESLEFTAQGAVYLFSRATGQLLQRTGLEGRSRTPTAGP